MEAGVYLVCMKPLYLSDEIYQADPYLITLPGFMENIEKTGDGKYVWMRNAEVDLKAGKEGSFKTSGTAGRKGGTCDSTGNRGD